MFIQFFLTRFIAKSRQIERKHIFRRRNASKSRQQPPVWPDGRIKCSPISLKFAKNVDTAVFTLKVILFKKPKHFSRYLAFFFNKICCQELFKIAQSGRTESHIKLLLSSSSWRSIHPSLNKSVGLSCWKKYINKREKGCSRRKEKQQSIRAGLNRD